MLAIVALCGLTLAGCTPGVGNCGQAIRPAPLISVQVKPWIDAHPDTNVRVCADGNCTTGYSTVDVTGQDPATPFHDGDTIEITAEPVQGENSLESFTKTARLSHDQCGQWGAQLKLSADGRITQARR